MKTDALNIGKMIVAQLKDIIRCYPIVADKGAAAPFLTYERISMTSGTNKDYRKDFNDYVRMTLTVVAQTYNQSVELAMKVKDSLDGHRGLFKGDDVEMRIESISFVTGSEAWNNDEYIQSMTFDIELDNDKEFIM